MISMENKRVLFYSSVRSKELFNIQQFYRIDINILKEMGNNVILSNSVCDAFKFWKYDYVFAYFYKLSLFVALIAKLFGRNTYFTGGIDALEKTLVSENEYKIQKLCFKICHFLSKKCIIVSKTDECNVKAIVNQNSNKLVYSEHTIDTHSFRCSIEGKANYCSTIVWQGTVGNVQRKGVDTALKLFAKLKQVPHFRDYKFFIIGLTGDGTQYLKNLVEELCIENDVIFTDSVSEEDKSDYLKKSKIYFQLSHYEGFGVAALEALCAKNIVVHSGNGGLGNPIYKRGILLDINKPIDSMFNDLIRDLNTYDQSSLDDIYNTIAVNYDNPRRKSDFLKIINE